MELAAAEGTQSIRHAVGRPYGKKWTAIKVFNENNRKIIKAEIERRYPDTKGSGDGHFKYWPEIKAKCFQSLTQEEKQFYADLADTWNWFGATPEVKAA